MGFGIKKSVKSLIQLTSANVAVKVLSLAVFALFTHYLTKEELAILPVYEMLAALSGIFFGFGLQPTFMRILPAKYTEDYEGARGLIFSGGGLLVAGSIVFAAGVFLLADWLNPVLFKGQDYALIIRTISLGFFFISLKNVANLVLWSMSRFDKLSLIQITAAIGRAVFVGGFMLLWGIKGMTVGLVVNEILCAGMAIFFARDILRGPRPPRYPLRKLLRESLPFYFEGFLIYFRSQGDNWIVATMLGPATMAVYFVAKRLPAMMMMFIESLDKVVTSEVSQRRNDPAAMDSYLKRLFLVNAHITLPGSIFVMGMIPLFILVVAGREYTASIIPCIILCSVLPLQAFLIPLSRAIFVIHPPMVRVIMTVLESVVLLLSLFLLAPVFHESGIAMSRVLAAVAALLMALAVLRRTTGLSLPWGQALLSMVFALVMGGTMLGLQMWNNNLYLSPAYALGGIILFLVMVHMFNSRAYYQVLNTVLPFHLEDPVQTVIRVLGRQKVS